MDLSESPFKEPTCPDSMIVEHTLSRIPKRGMFRTNPTLIGWVAEVEIDRCISEFANLKHQ